MEKAIRLLRLLEKKQNYLKVENNTFKRHFPVNYFFYYLPSKIYVKYKNLHLTLFAVKGIFIFKNIK